MKLNKIFSALMLIAAVSFAACGDQNIPDDNGPGGNTNDSTQNDPNQGETLGDTITVADLLKMKEDGTLPAKDSGTKKYWVKAYIVGSYYFDEEASKGEYVIGTDNAANTNILIADDAETTDSYAVASVKLDAGFFRNALNIKDNPGNLKKEVLLYGVVEAYYGIGGVVKIEKAHLDGQELVKPTVDAQPGDTLSVAELSIMEVPAKDTGVDKYWVKGYIVGTYTNFNFELGTANAVNSSILLADDPETTDNTQVAPIKLESSSIYRNVLNILDNPDNYKKEVLLYGVVEKYCGVPGLVKVEKAYIEGEDVFTEKGACTIKEFLEKKDKTGIYTLTGTVLIPEGKSDFTPPYGNFDLEDETGKIYIYGLLTPEGEPKKFESLGIEEGDNITLKGSYTEYNGTPQIAPATFVKKN